MTSESSLIARRAFETQKLVEAFPPILSHPNKQAVYRIACPPGSRHSGQLIFSRWAMMNLPEALEGNGSQTRFEHRPDYFGYEPRPSSDSTMEWYLNFAHHDLFCAYGGRLFAQDEMQVAEHPALGSLREALLKSDLKPWTVEAEMPTPILIRGVERRCRIALEPNAGLGRPNGLYGNQFARASAEAVQKATERIEPPTITNLLAMEAPVGGSGEYSLKQIDYILRTAYTGFAAARFESTHDRAQAPEVIVHTGFWGCGAYGGNRVLMTLLQLLAARLAGLDLLVFHTGDAAGTAPFLKAKNLLETELAPPGASHSIFKMLRQIEAYGWRWGVSDGN